MEMKAKFALFNYENLCIKTGYHFPKAQRKYQ